MPGFFLQRIKSEISPNIRQDINIHELDNCNDNTNSRTALIEEDATEGNGYFCKIIQFEMWILSSETQMAHKISIRWTDGLWKFNTLENIAFVYLLFIFVFAVVFQLNFLIVGNCTRMRPADKESYSQSICMCFGGRTDTDERLLYFVGDKNHSIQCETFEFHLHWNWTIRTRDSYYSFFSFILFVSLSVATASVLFGIFFSTSKAI